jgi:hypothetical protein
MSEKRSRVSWRRPSPTRSARHTRAARYPEPSFSHLLGGLWLKACWEATPAVGWLTVGRRLLASPLRRWAWPGLRKDAYLNVPRPIAWLAGIGLAQTA